LIGLLKCENKSIRNAAALALENIPTQIALEPLIEAIKKDPDNCQMLTAPLSVIDCTVAVEFLVELFIKKTDAPIARLHILACFKSGAIKKITPEVAKKIKIKLTNAFDKYKEDRDIKALYELIKRVYIDDNSWGEFDDEFDDFMEGFDFLVNK